MIETGRTAESACPRCQAMKSVLLLFLLGSSLVHAAVTNAWQRTDHYVAPDFNGYFPADTEGGDRLAQLEKSGQLETLPAGEVVSAVQKGLTTTKAYRLSILRTLGNRFIWGRSPQDAGAIELMYHAAGYAIEPDPQSTVHFAVYFGLSVVEPKTPNILRTLVDICMRRNDPNILSRVAWGIHSQRAECIAYLEPYLDSTDEKVRGKARVVEGILKQELEAFAWAKEQARKQAEATYRGELPEIKRLLTEGSSEEREAVLKKIFQGSIALIMDDTFIPAFASCSRDLSSRVRENVAVLVGENWIWFAKEQRPGAIQLMLELTRDPEREVRYKAVYHGLSTVRGKSEEVTRRLVELYLKEGTGDLQWRIDWGLHLGSKEEQDKTASIIAEYLNDPDTKLADAAATWHRSWSQRAAAQKSKGALPNPLGTNSVVVMRRFLSEPRFQAFFVRLIDGQVLFVPRRDSLALGENVAVLVDAQDQVRTIDPRQVAAIEEVPEARRVK